MADLLTPFSEALFQKVPVVGILRGYDIEFTLKCIDIYAEAGFTSIEITMNTPAVVDIIKTAVKKYRGKLNVGAGTVCTDEDLVSALKAGAQFIVSPITDVDMISKCVAEGVPIFPGAFTPTEIYKAWKAGARMVKLFPAGQLGPQYLKDVLAPLDFIEIMPTGGVSLENIDVYQSYGAKAFGMGSLLFKKELIRKSDWAGLKVQMLKVKSKL